MMRHMRTVYLVPPRCIQPFRVRTSDGCAATSRIFAGGVRNHGRIRLRADGEVPRSRGRYASMVAARPDDARLRLAYGEALLGDGQAATACSEFDKLRDKGSAIGISARRQRMPRERGSGCRDCLAEVNPSAVPPPSVGEEPAFADLRN